MTRVSRNFSNTVQKKALPAVSADEIVARKTTLLLDQQNRLSIHDLTNKFEKGLTTAAKLSEEARIRKAAPLGKHVYLKKLRDVLESLKGRVVGRNKDDVEEVS
ncbi:hypothetical protein GOBAR_AA15522 [Gossypium barbadense]|uniref:Uncharacterized protein n=1 Tax=Gossypium barbadense TaxID=3634 RepID=A0A2P5XP72_GOSBA|nr:hypothetical protein GOBAR_AA15522 [Gossypium barbadense]